LTAGTDGNGACGNDFVGEAMFDSILRWRCLAIAFAAFNSAIFVEGPVAMAQIATPTDAAPAFNLPTTTSSSQPAIDPFHELETKYIFGFTSGSDIGAEGERAIEFETTGAFQKRHGRYTAIEQEIEFEGVPTQNFAYELSAHGTYHAIKGVDDLDDFTRAQFSGLSADLRYLILGRGPGSPIGLTIGMQPEWSRIDGTSGARTTGFANAVKIIADTEVIPNRLYAAVNASYEPEVSKAPGDKAWESASSLGLTGALAYRIMPKVTMGGEVEYYRDYDGLFINRFAAHAVYVGPTLHIQFTGKTMLALAFSAQVYGHAAGEDGSLDLTNFERYHANAKLEFEF